MWSRTTPPLPITINPPPFHHSKTFPGENSLVPRWGRSFEPCWKSEITLRFLQDYLSSRRHGNVRYLSIYHLDMFYISYRLIFAGWSWTQGEIRISLTTPLSWLWLLPRVLGHADRRLPDSRADLNRQRSRNGYARIARHGVSTADGPVPTQDGRHGHGHPDAGSTG